MIFDDEARLNYARVWLTSSSSQIMSAREYDFFEYFFERAKKNVMEKVNPDESDSEPYRIVYGGILVSGMDGKQKALKSVNDMKGCDLANTEGERVGISEYEDIVFPDEGTDDYIPFAALMKTSMQINDRGRAVTYFPYVTGVIWIDIICRRFLLAAGRAAEFTGTKEDWINHVNTEDWITAYKSAPFITGEGNTENRVLPVVSPESENRLRRLMERCIHEQKIKRNSKQGL